MKKTFKIIFVNILSIIIIFAVFEYIALFTFLKMYWGTDTICDFAKAVYTFHYKNLYFNDYEFREPSLQNEKQNTVLLLGCSYTYADSLSENETFSYKLADYTNYNVYNYGISGGSPREALYILDSGYLNDKITNPESVKYVIYTFIDDIIRRVYYNNRPVVPWYKRTAEDGLEYIKYSPLLRFRILQNYNVYKYNNKVYDLEILKLYFTEMNRKIKAKFPNAQFIILNYDNSQCSVLEDLKVKHNIPVINTFDILNFDICKPEYQISEDENHPNAKAWDIIVPALAKELNL